MLVIGAGGHARELLQVLVKQQQQALFFFDNVTGITVLYNEFTVLNTLEQVRALLQQDPAYAIGVGGTFLRSKLNSIIAAEGGRLESVICPTALIGSFEVQLGAGLNIMSNVFISNSVVIAKGSLLNYGASVHHDVTVGMFSELAPKCQLLGGAAVGDYTSIGAGAVVLPGIKVGSNVKVGAGAVVNKDVPDNCVVAGVPARKIKDVLPLVL